MALRALKGLSLLHCLCNRPSASTLAGCEEELVDSLVSCSDKSVVGSVFPGAGVLKELELVCPSASDFVLVIASTALVEARLMPTSRITVATADAADGDLSEWSADAFSVVTCAGEGAAADMIEGGRMLPADTLGSVIADSTFSLYPLPPGKVDTPGGGVTEWWSTTIDGYLVL
jgi:hypothetical protein